MKDGKVDVWRCVVAGAIGQTPPSRVYDAAPLYLMNACTFLRSHAFFFSLPTR